MVLSAGPEVVQMYSQPRHNTYFECNVNTSTQGNNASGRSSSRSDALTTISAGRSVLATACALTAPQNTALARRFTVV